MMKAILLGNGSREGVLDGVEALTPILERFVEIVSPAAAGSGSAPCRILCPDPGFLPRR